MPLEIEVAAIHHIEGARFRGQLIEHIDVVHSCRRDAQENRDSPAQVQQGVQLQGVLFGREVRSISTLPASAMRSDFWRTVRPRAPSACGAVLAHHVGKSAAVHDDLGCATGA